MIKLYNNIKLNNNNSSNSINIMINNNNSYFNELCIASLFLKF